ncbi:hypothetical protein [Corallococcus exiguus]|uniref:Uncharacterized protein n=1 Tax=Corallococcus exiguus TaxID=83462 RepID=A0A7X4YJ49_9BACT|nr:hypothetical protein [Corallococcus exiguus]NBC46359.1 hypothetical protein [Corallococcus exiguus]TNV45364.1 hypothetical protein FH620_42855 [Corallococcus exiguus]
MDWSRYGNPEMVNWEGRGYFAYPEVMTMPLKGEGERLPQEGDYFQWLEALRRAKLGDFSQMPELVELGSGDTHPVNRRLCAELLGDAGPASTVDTIAERLASEEVGLELTLAWGAVLTRRGKLADVPIVLAAFERVATISDAEILPVHISGCLETEYELSDHQDYDSLDSYRNAVLNRCAELADRFGTDQVCVDGGEQLSVIGLAHRILRRLREPYFPFELRRRFECAAGIDCSSFYLDRTFRPMQASALLEAFLEDSHATWFKSGVRYFFGHRIPD